MSDKDKELEDLKQKWPLLKELSTLRQAHHHARQSTTPKA